MWFILPCFANQFLGCALFEMFSSNRKDVSLLFDDRPAPDMHKIVKLRKAIDYPFSYHNFDSIGIFDLSRTFGIG